MVSSVVEDGAVVIVEEDVIEETKVVSSVVDEGSDVILEEDIVEETKVVSSDKVEVTGSIKVRDEPD